jgi:hypothetical protein
MGNKKLQADFSQPATDYKALGDTIVAVVNAGLLEAVGVSTAAGVAGGVLTGVLSGLLGPVGTTIAASLGAVAVTAAAPII